METSLTVEIDSLRKHIKGAIASQKRPTITVLSSLLAIQDSVGYIPNEAIEEVAIAMKTTINTVFGVASFYPNFRFSPPGDHSVEVCWGPTCHLLGAGKVLDEVLEQLGLEDEGDTPDGKLHFRKLDPMGILRSYELEPLCAGMQPGPSELRID